MSLGVARPLAVACSGTGPKPTRWPSNRVRVVHRVGLEGRVYRGAGHIGPTWASVEVSGLAP